MDPSSMNDKQHGKVIYVQLHIIHGGIEHTPATCNNVQKTIS